ncbi:GNAT family N-acetyltransferase [Helicobacter burdigaliensis]|uniref:GNAT family N-acetyltransferase n=1 Tax=Helicobacter burdigaliensis TaxID=2315334 RepID=UPI000EF714BB|nr:GNAT family N-acetyltransferase [Helicobacter burdigaliensis]
MQNIFYTTLTSKTKKLKALLSLWEESVRSSHTFLKESDISNLKNEVEEGILACEILLVQNKEEILGFIGVFKNKIEMLFVAKNHFKKGIGKRLIYEACMRFLQNYTTIELDCNTQNTNAFIFYQNLGFIEFAQSPKDSKGRDFPITHFSAKLSSLLKYTCTPILSTKRTNLHYLNKRDFKALHSIFSKIEVMYAWGHGFSTEDTQDWLEKRLQSYQKDGLGFYALVLKDTNTLIGTAGLQKTKIQEKEVIEIGWILDKPYWKQGYGIEVATEIRNYAFNVLNLKEIYCIIKENNFASLNLANKLGFKKKSTFIRHYRNQDMPHHLLFLENNLVNF